MFFNFFSSFQLSRYSRFCWISHRIIVELRLNHDLNETRADHLKFIIAEIVFEKFAIVCFIFLIFLIQVAPIDEANLKKVSTNLFVFELENIFYVFFYFFLHGIISFVYFVKTILKFNIRIYSDCVFFSLQEKGGILRLLIMLDS